jgi:arylsulfatase A
VRDGSWKLILSPDPADKSADAPPVQLYNLDDDIGETKNLAAAMPEKVAEMRAMFERIITSGRSTPGPRQRNDQRVTRHGPDAPSR